MPGRSMAKAHLLTSTGLQTPHIRTPAPALTALPQVTPLIEQGHGLIKAKQA